MDDRKLDTVSEDFVDDGEGGFEACDVIENKIAFSYKLDAGSWEGDPELGHRFKELERAQNTAENRARLKNLAELAVQWLVDGGELDRVDVTVEAGSSSAGMDRVKWEVDYYLPGDSKPKKAGPFLIAVGA